MRTFTKTQPIQIICFCIAVLLSISGCGAVLSEAKTREVVPPTYAPTQASEVSGMGDPVVGEAIFTGRMKIEGVVPCSMCHYIESHQRVLVGPNLAGISERAGDTIPGMNAAKYLRESIREPEAYTVDGFPPGTMNQSYDERLSEQHVNDIIAYLMTR